MRLLCGKPSQAGCQVARVPDPSLPDTAMPWQEASFLLTLRFTLRVAMTQPGYSLSANIALFSSFLQLLKRPYLSTQSLLKYLKYNLYTSHTTEITL